MLLDCSLGSRRALVALIRQRLNIPVETPPLYYRRAKDPEGLRRAITLKLEAQRDFVAWWDGQEHDRGGGNVTGDRSVTAYETLDTFGLDKKTVSRWRLRLGDPEVFDKRLAEVSAKCLSICAGWATGTSMNSWGP